MLPLRYEDRTQLVEIGARSRNLKGHGLDEGVSTRMLIHAGRLIKGGSIGAESSTNKIFWSELDRQMHATALSILGARAELEPFAPDAGNVGKWLDGWLFSQSGPIYAGTNEIQRNIIAERMLGMPRK